MLHTLSKIKVKIAKYTAIIFLVLSFFYFAISLFVQYNASVLKGQEILSRDQSFIQSVGAVINSRMTRIISDLIFIKDSFEISYHPDADQNGYDETLKTWRVFAGSKKVYDQIRYIDADGNEVLRINYLESGAYIVPQDKLENIKDRYYFTDSIKLPDDSIYISRMDLHVEGSQVQTFPKPMIRLATPVFGANHALKGIIILNYMGNDLFRQVNNVLDNNTGAFYMLNADGYWLYNSEDKDKEWAFMYADKADVSFKQQYPAEWAALQQGDSGTLITGNGAFVYGRIFTAKAYEADSGAHPLTLGSGDWYIVSRIPLDSDPGRLVRTSIPNLAASTLGNSYYAYIMILLISLVIATLIGITRMEQDTIKYFSEYDTMTGMLNRRAGLEKLSKQYIANPDRRCQASICFADINGLKEINDTLGHEVGDELIISVADIIKKSIREQDLVVRLGGDEFLIVFVGLDETACETVWNRILDGFEEVNHTENRKYLISVSHGIETYHCNSSQYLDSIINSADEKMYAEKKIIKKDLRVIREMPAKEGKTEEETV